MTAAAQWSSAQSSSAQRGLGWALLAVVALTMVGTADLDTGYNFDQQRILQFHRDTVRELRWTQPDHTWNGIVYLPGLAVSLGYLAPELPQVISELAHGPRVPLSSANSPTLAAWQEDMYRRIGSERFKIEMRAVYLAFALPVLLWIFLAVLRLYPGRYLAAAAAAGFIGLSWEFTMHTRWTELDPTMTMFVALALYLMTCALTARTRGGGLATALGLGAAVGCVLGCKVSGVWLVVPATIALFQIRFWRGLRDRLTLMGAFWLALLMVYGAVSPDSWIDPLGVLNHGFFQIADYRSIGEEYPAYVSPPFGHFARICRWLFTVQPSSVPAFAVGLSLISAVGAYALVRSRRRAALTLGVYPLMLMFFMSRLPLFQLRNYLQLIPFVALAFGAGLIWLWARLPRAWMRTALAAAVTLVLAFNAGWLAHVQHSMQSTTRETIHAEVRGYIETTDHDLLVSPRAYTTMREALDARFECARRPPSSEPALESPEVLMYYMDHSPWRWRIAVPGLAIRWFAPLELDHDWLTLWKGKIEQHRFVLLTEERAVDMTVPVHVFYRCHRR